MIGQMGSSFYVTVVYYSTAALFVGVCGVLIVFNDDINVNLRDINHSFIKIKRNSKRNMTDARSKLLEIIEVYSNARR